MYVPGQENIYNPKTDFKLTFPDKRIPILGKTHHKQKTRNENWDLKLSTTQSHSLLINKGN